MQQIRISSRATAAQRSAWQAAAHTMGMTPSEYLRRAVEAQMRADRDEAAEAVQCTHIVLAATHDAGRDAAEEQARYAAANLRWAALASALEGFSHG